MKKLKKFKSAGPHNSRTMLVWVALFAFIGAVTLIITRAATPGMPVTVDPSLPKVTNIKAYPDDRTVTLTWDSPGGSSIIGYYVKWGKKGGPLTHAKQTDAKIIQIQPLDNGVEYDVTVQTVQGSIVQVGTPEGWKSTASEGRANGKVSTPVATTATPTSARVDDLRTKMTGFFNDFNHAAGGFDELKWNTATSACAMPGESGAFINAQFHAHSQIRSSQDPYCDRAQMIQRPRAIFDITGRTEADPGVIVGDFDGTTMETKRDIFYIDLIPVNTRTNGIPIDVTGHSSAADDIDADPAMIRIFQSSPSLSLLYTGYNKQSNSLNETFRLCTDFKPSFDFGWCGGGSAPIVNSAFPQSEVPLLPYNGQIPVPNVRHHWRIEVSPTKLKLFINGARTLEGNMPADFANTKQFVVHSNVFSYNTGKDSFDTQPSTLMLHWDNFGFNGPSPTTVTHNYLEGGVSGTVPYLGTGTIPNPVPGGSRSTKVNIPDPIGLPKQSRLMFTLNNIGFGDYSWKASDHVLVNGKKYDLPNPASVQLAPILPGPVAGHFIPYASGIILSNADVKQGMNDIRFNISGTDVINAHIELEYNNGTEPAYTPPKDIFSASLFNSSIQPTMRSHDSYLYIEQDFGLPSGLLDNPVPPPNPTPDTTKPTISITSPANNANVTAGGSVNVTANAQDNVAISKVEFYLGGQLKDTKQPPAAFSTSISLAGLAPGTYAIDAMAYDTSNNTTSATTINIIVPTPPPPPPAPTPPPPPADTTAPTVSITSPASGSTVGGSVAVSATASDNVAVTKVELRVNGAISVTDLVAPYNFTWNTSSLSNGTYSLTARAYDAANNSTTSTAVSLVVNNSVALKPGDVNGDAKVDIFDLSILLTNYSRTSATRATGDLNGDTRVDIFDLSILLGAWGS